MIQVTDVVCSKKNSSSNLKCPHCDREFTRPGNLYWHCKDKKCRKKKQIPVSDIALRD